MRGAVKGASLFCNGRIENMSLITNINYFFRFMHSNQCDFFPVYIKFIERYALDLPIFIGVKVENQIF